MNPAGQNHSPRLAARALALVAISVIVAACSISPTVNVPDRSTAVQTVPTASRSVATVATQPENEPTPAQPVTATVSPPVRSTAPAETAVPLADYVDARVNEIMARLSLEEKVGQIFLIYFNGPVLSSALKQMIGEYHIGGIVLFARVGNIQNPTQVAQLINNAQQHAVSSSAKIPLFVAIDQEGGPVVRLPDEATLFPSNMSLAATGSEEYARAMAAVTADELRALGINMNFAPVLDVNDNPVNPVIGVRSFSSSPEMVARFGAAMVDTYWQNGIIATAKHFPGHGNTSVDSHFGLPRVDRDLAGLNNIELLPFREVVQSGADAIMTAHVLFPAVEPNPDLPATLSANVLQKVLRQQLGFEGVIFSDSMTMGALEQGYGSAKASVMALEAGVDVLAWGADQGRQPDEQRIAYRQVLNAVRGNPALQVRLDDAVRRILRLKAKYGLLDWQPVDTSQISAHVGTPAHRQVADDIAQKSITLVKDDAGLIRSSVSAADRISRKTALVLPASTAYVMSLATQLRGCMSNVQVQRVADNPSAADISRAISAAASSEQVIVVTANAFVRARNGQTRLVQALAERANERLIVVAIASPYDLLSFPQVSTYLATYSDVPASLQAVANVLCGKAKPTGRLPVDLPGLFPLGHGLQ